MKACYLHYLLDFFKETNVNIFDVDLVFEKFLQKKIYIEIVDENNRKVSFQHEIDEIFRLIKENKDELFDDLKGAYLINKEKSKNKKLGV